MKYVKLFFLAGFLAVAAYLLINKPASSTPVIPGRVVITYWEKWTGHEAEQMQEIVDDFNKTVGAQKGIFVQYLSVSSVDRKTLVATAAGVPPDVAGLWDGQVPQFAALDAVEPLDELARAHGITDGYYKPVFWKGCKYEGKLWALVSTPAAVALHYNRRLFKENADLLRAAGLDPDRPPKTLDELDRYAVALDQKDEHGRILRAGYLPKEPGWFLVHTAYWFGGTLFDEEKQKFTLTDPKVVKAFNWVRSYSERLGKQSMTEFQSGQGGFNSPLNPFLAGTVVMEQQGPWMANYIQDLKSSMNQWNMPQEMLDRLKAGQKVSMKERRPYYEWAAVPFPAIGAGMENTTFCSFDVLMIPKGAKHKKEAFEFIAYVNRQDVMEKLCSLHCKNSPLAKVSQEFIDNHLNPCIAAFEEMSASPNAHCIPACPIWMEAMDEMNIVTDRVCLLLQDTEAALAEAQERLQQKYDRFKARQDARHAQAGPQQ